MSNEYKLLCCPFCGELPIITKHHREEMYVFMHRCEVLGPIGRDFREDPMSHVEMWNTRIAAAPQPPAISEGWAIDHSAGRPILTYKGCSVIEAEDAEYVMGLVAKDKMPALGGEPEVLGWTNQIIAGNYGTRQFMPFTEEQEGFYRKHGIRIVELIDRAHLAPLQAEIVRQAAQFKDWQASHHRNYVAVAEERDQLKARRDELEGLLAEAMHFEVGELDQDSWEELRGRVAALYKPAGSEQ
ncbi:hypothetical protein K0038_02534 [Pseudomonas syringae]|uniref:Lar family restriction alleviation protein n=1 Tax=Pseudomonas syringae TaxID=317 RepID=UPI001CA97CFE|nr:Lar family restriction alleviation protein [Pseudomonas syringae]MCI3945492.1 hypothetical protein [Pseudomonas syringae]